MQPAGLDLAAPVSPAPTTQAPDKLVPTPLDQCWQLPAEVFSIVPTSQGWGQAPQRARSLGT